MSSADIAAILVTDPTNIMWLTGFNGTFARILVTATDAVFITDSRYAIQAQEQVHDIRIVTFGSPKGGDDIVSEQIAELGIKRLSYESSSVTVNQSQAWTKRFEGTEFVSVPDLFAKLRQIKSEVEIAAIKDACSVTDAAFAHICRMVQPGVTELDLELDLEFYIRRQGAKVAFPSIVVSGANSARPHGHATDKKLEVGDFVTFDFGAQVRGYNADMTRTVVVGKASDRHVEVYNAVLRAEMESIEMIQVGVRAEDIDANARRILGDLAPYFGHGLGHGLGLLVHDTGRLGVRSEDVMTLGQIWTVEPGVYIEGFGGCRIEDDIVVREFGAEILNKSPKELLILG